jgi:hypothetical protein
MKSKASQTASATKTSNLKNFTPLSRKQLQIITGGDDPKLSRGTKTSASD